MIEEKQAPSRPPPKRKKREIDEDALRDLLKVDPEKVKKAVKWRKKKQREKRETD